MTRNGERLMRFRKYSDVREEAIQSGRVSEAGIAAARRDLMDAGSARIAELEAELFLANEKWLDAVMELERIRAVLARRDAPAS